MSSRHLESVVSSVSRRVFGRHIVDPGRAARFVMFCAVGGTGALIDIGLTLGLIQATTVHYLLANGAGFILAVSWNFTGNWMWTYGRPDGRLWRQYLSYVGLHGATFGVRALVVTAGVEMAGASATVASLVGLGVAAALNFGGTETIFNGAGEVWFDAVEAANHVAHVVYGSRARRWLMALGLYDACYGLYARVLALMYPTDERKITVGDSTAKLSMKRPTEVVSNLHTLEKESEVLERFVDDIEPGDHVLDVGANLGVYATLAQGAGARVTAVEPHPNTARHLARNIARNGWSGTVVQAAMGDTESIVQLECQRDDIGTQRPKVSESGDIPVSQVRGGRLLRNDPPDVIKIDVEGGELSTLHGMVNLLDQTRVCYVEAHGDGVSELEAWFEEFGLHVERLTDGHETHLRAV